MAHLTVIFSSSVDSDLTGQEMVISVPGSTVVAGLTVGLFRMKRFSGGGISPITAKVVSYVATAGTGGRVIALIGIVGPA
ncbi:unnamed protein product [marine sediment metagenome]|uniref:Uncharacterized protein n=1 Tax=marine sediment metagenome TaxID=412755 RepID=X1TMQ1_9ZZZZ